MKKENKRERGVTLIALVVTIIVLLLLAGVSFLAITGENSIFDLSKKSGKDTERESLKEEIQLQAMDSYDDNGFNVDKLKEKIKEEYGINPDEMVDAENGGFTFPLDGYIVKVDKDENGKPKVEIEGEGNKEELPEPPTLAGSDTKIEFDPSDWTNKGVKVTIKLDKKIDKGANVLQYSTDGGINWNTYKKAFEVVKNNTVIIARLYNGVNESSGYATGTITRIDKLPPKILSVEETHTTSTVTITTNAKEEEATDTDGESGIAKYYFMMNNSGKWEESDNPQYTFDKLKQNKEYTFKVKVTDVAKNETVREEETKVTTKKLEDLGQETSNTVIDFSPDDWTADGVQVTITTNAEIGEGARLQYSTNGGTDWADYNDTPFMVYENETVVIARLYDGTNESGYATGTVTKIDKVAPSDVHMEVIGDKKTSKIEVRVSAKDSLSGIKKYKFYYSTNGGASYIEAGTKEVAQSNESTTTYEYEKLTDNTNYKLKVEAYDYVNNKNEGEVTIEGSTKAMPNVNNNNLKISFTPTTWTREVTVTITPTGLDIEDSEIQYMIEGGSWTPYNDTPFTVSKNNTAVVARLWDGTNESSTSTGTITLIDRENPSTVSISENTKDASSITVNYSAADGSETTESGKSGIKKFMFYYSTNNGSSYTYKDTVTLSTSNTGTYSSTYKYTGLIAGNTYRLKVEAYDEVGNMKSAETASGGIQLGTAPVMSSLSASRDWTSSAGHSITLTVSATDQEGGTLNYNVQYGTSTSYGKTATGSATAGSSTTIKLTGLSEYTRYYYKVTATDSTGITSTNYKDGNYRTYCIGTYCSGGWYSYRTCTTCGGSGYRSGSTPNGTTCGTCSGSGTISVANSATCGTCSGSGTVSTTTQVSCTSCSGTGKKSTTSTCSQCKGKKKVTCSNKRCIQYRYDATHGVSYYRCGTCGYTCTAAKNYGEYSTSHKRSCPTCSGTGSVTSSSNCSTCSGTGKVSSTTSTSCTTCGGDGKVTGTSSCTTCGGDGKVTYYYTYDCSYCDNGSERYSVYCSHGYWNSHYRCSTHGENAGQKHGDP